jgi:ADP-ribose pyrophosphatase YjhB (NUDIX family)
MTEPPAEQRWLAWAQRLRAIAQTGIAYSQDGYDLERFEEVSDIAEEMLAALTASLPGRLRDIYLPERGYPTPKVDVRAGVFRDGDGPACVLLVQEASDGRWSLPGGWADEHESPRQSIEREVQEESGYRVRAVKLALVRDRSLHPYQPPRLERIYKLFFVCELTGGAPAPSLETTGAAFFPLDCLPELSPGRTLPDDVTALATHHRQPGLPTSFD